MAGPCAGEPRHHPCRRALRAEATENKFAFAKDPLAEGTRPGPGHVEPGNVLDIAATVADEVVMLHAFRVEARGTTLDGYFTNQPRLYQVPQVVVSRGSGRARVHTIHGFEDFPSRRMPVVFHEERHHGIALGRTPQPGAVEGTLNRLGIHRKG